ncbi:MAG: hypothetical protein ACRDD2_04415 [Sarcina sp.]
MITFSVYTLFWLVIGILGAVALVYLIVLLFNLTNLIKNINNILVENKKDLAKSIENIQQISDNAKDISDVLTETTAEALVAKENITNQISSMKHSLGAVFDLFSLFRKK